MNPPFPLSRSLTLLLPPLIFCRNLIGRRYPLELTLLQFPLVPLPQMVLHLRLVPAVPESSPHLTSMLTTSSSSRSCQEPLLLLLSPVLPLHACRRAWVHHWTLQRLHLWSTQCLGRHLLWLSASHHEAEPSSHCSVTIAHDLSGHSH
jgi:hypothetical protein